MVARAVGIATDDLAGVVDRWSAREASKGAGEVGAGRARHAQHHVLTVVVDERMHAAAVEERPEQLTAAAALQHRGEGGPWNGNVLVSAVLIYERMADASAILIGADDLPGVVQLPCYRA